MLLPLPLPKSVRQISGVSIFQQVLPRSPIKWQGKAVWYPSSASICYLCACGGKTDKRADRRQTQDTGIAETCREFYLSGELILIFTCRVIGRKRASISRVEGVKLAQHTTSRRLSQQGLGTLLRCHLLVQQIINISMPSLIAVLPHCCQLKVSSHLSVFTYA